MREAASMILGTNCAPARRSMGCAMYTSKEVPKVKSIKFIDNNTRSKGHFSDIYSMEAAWKNLGKITYGDGFRRRVVRNVRVMRKADAGAV